MTSALLALALSASAAGPADLPAASAATSDFRAEVLEVMAWYDAMPSFDAAGGPEENRHFLAEVRLTNLTDRELPVELSASRLSVSSEDSGAPVPLSFRGGARIEVLPPSGAAVVGLTGEGAFEHGLSGRRLYATFTFSAGGRSASVRASCPVAVVF